MLRRLLHRYCMRHLDAGSMRGIVFGRWHELRHADQPHRVLPR
jgi:hypothetical protein